MQNLVILASPAQVVEVALYQAESSLPGLKRYLSLQEQRFLGVKSPGIDTLRLAWRKAELVPGEYLIGIYAYRGGKWWPRRFTRWSERLLQEKERGERGFSPLGPGQVCG